MIPPGEGDEGKGKGKEVIDPKSFVELKTNIVIESQRDEVMFERSVPHSDFVIALLTERQPKTAEALCTILYVPLVRRNAWS